MKNRLNIFMGLLSLLVLTQVGSIYASKKAALDIGKINDQGKALMEAIKGGKMIVIKQALASIANNFPKLQKDILNWQDVNGDTALHMLMALHRDIKTTDTIVDLLLNAGAAKNIKNSTGLYPLQLLALEHIDADWQDIAAKL